MKKWIAFLLALVMCLSVCACGNQATNNQSADAPDYATLAEPENGKEALSVLSCDISFAPKGAGDWYYCDFKVQNDVEVTINTVTISVVFLDKDGNVVKSSYPQEPTRLRPGQAEVIQALCEMDVDPVECYVDNISYYDGEGNYHEFYLDNPEMFKMP